MVLTSTAIFKLYKLLPKTYKRKLIRASITVFIMAITDLVSLGVLLPVLLLVLDKDSVFQNHYTLFVYQILGFESKQAFIVVVCLAVFIISLGRTLLNTYLQYSQSKRLYEISNYLSLRFYQLYYSSGFLFIKRRNSLRLINRINGVAQYLIQGYFIPFTSLICEFLVILSLLIGLILFNPSVFLLAILAFVPLSLTYYRYSRARIKKYGELLYEIIPEKNKLLQQTFVGYTDMEMNNSFSVCKQNYEKLLKKQSFYSVRSALLNSTLQRVLELAVVCAIIALIIANTLFQFPHLAVVIGMFVIAVYRILPGVIKGSSFYFTMRANTFALDFLDDIDCMEKEKQNPVRQAIMFKDTICLNSVSFSYDKTVPIIRNLSLEIKKGDFIGIKGESGSGKSTLFHLLLGFLQPDSGSIEIDNIPLSTEHMDCWRSKIGYVSQQLFMIEGSLSDNIIMGASEFNRDRIYEVLKLASLDKFVDSLPQGIDTKIGEGGCLLSGGQRQRLGIARALYKNVELLLFDEATSSLDETTEKSINRAIIHLSDKRRDLTMLIISHRAESLAICQKIINLTDIQST